jgi:hypothetical protein
MNFEAVVLATTLRFAPPSIASRLACIHRRKRQAPPRRCRISADFAVTHEEEPVGRISRKDSSLFCRHPPNTGDSSLGGRAWCRRPASAQSISRPSQEGHRQPLGRISRGATSAPEIKRARMPIAVDQIGLRAGGDGRGHRKVDAIASRRASRVTRPLAAQAHLRKGRRAGPHGVNQPHGRPGGT